MTHWSVCLGLMMSFRPAISSYSSGHSNTTIAPSVGSGLMYLRWVTEGQAFQELLGISPEKNLGIHG